MKVYILSKPAERDLDEISAYLVEEAGGRVARRVLRELRQAMKFLSQNPGAGHLREDLADRPVKFWPVYSYLIVYDPAAAPIEILRVVHGARNIDVLP